MRRSLARDRDPRALRARTHAVVLAGGAGERFWPVSRVARPKPLLQVLDHQSLLQATLDRARRVASADRVWVVCAQELARRVAADAALPTRRVLGEPARCNTAMAVGLAAHRIAREEPEAVLVILPADHMIPDGRAFAGAIQRAAAAADRADVLVALGVRPTRPEPGYGYIQLGPPAGRGFSGLHRVRRFVEKPDQARARRYLRQGGFLWNAGIFSWKTHTLLEELARCAPALSRRLDRLREVPARGWGRAVRDAYRGVTPVSIDVAVLEKSRRVWSLPVRFRWSDVGTWASLAEELGVGRNVSCVTRGDVLLDDAPGNLVWAQDRLVALLGVEGLAVVDAGDALLVARLDRSAEVRRLVERLRRRGRSELL